MKRKILLLISFIILIIISALGSAVTSDLKSTYVPGETAVTKITGNILSAINTENIEIKRENVRMPFIYDVKKLGSDYYIWFIVSTNAQEGNYTLTIKDVQTTVAGTQKEIDFVQNFSVAGNITDYNVEPGFIYAKENFSLIVNSFIDSSFEIKIDKPSSKTYTINPGTNTIEFNIRDFSGTELSLINVGKYKLPLYIIKNSTIIESKKNYSLSVSVKSIDVIRLKSEKNINYTFSVINEGLKDLDDVVTEYNSDIFSISPSKKITIISGNKSTYLITIDKSYREDINETIYVKSEKNNLSVTIPVKITFVSNYSQIANESNSSTSSLTCIELKGDICSAGEGCNGDAVFSSNGVCCIGKCESLKSDSNGSNSAWGYILGLLALTVIVYIFIKYKKIGPEKNPLNKKIEESELKEKKKLP